MRKVQLSDFRRGLKLYAPNGAHEATIVATSCDRVSYYYVHWGGTTPRTIDKDAFIHEDCHYVKDFKEYYETSKGR